ncbi:MAG: secretory subunit [Cirrosporium novae-zelandiae]|nr:MAG: secretory subunit [Cirrosporium novae-zelandiae]
MSTDYNYDEQGQFFPFFILTLSGLVTIPLTISLLRPTKELENTAPRIKSDFKPDHADLIDGQKRKQKRRERRVKRTITVIIGWALIAYMMYLIITTQRTLPKLWDPYTILGISRSADETAIRKHYKRLSLKFHPDKIRPNAALNETVEMLNDRFVEITKAYKALTDEDIRNNFIKYGHPDGKQSFSIGIALPKWIIMEGNGKYVILVYGVLLGVMLPYIVGRWWYGTQRMTKEKVLVASAGRLFQEYKEDMSAGGVVGALSAGEEFKHILKGNKADTGLEKVETRVLQKNPEESSARVLNIDDEEKLKDLDGAQRKALGLLWAYLGRVELDDTTLNDEKFEVAPTALALTEAFSTIALAFMNVASVLATFRTFQHLIQAVPPHWSQLLQLPYFTQAIVKAVDGEDSRAPMTLQQFMAIPEAKRKSLVVGPNLSESQFNSSMAVAKQFPVMKIDNAFFKVMGERFITPSSLVQFVIKFRFVPLGTTNLPAVNGKDLEDVDPEEGDLDALLGRKSKSEGPKQKPVQPPLTHAPYFARDRSPRWHVFLTDPRQGKLAVPPFTFTTFEKPIFTEDGEPTFNVQTMKMQFQAPPQAAEYLFSAYIVCDSYIGLDTKLDVAMKVDPMEKATKFEEEEEISEPEEDSLAGQMQALKTGGLSGAPPKKKSKKKVDQSSDSDSDTEEEESETDTDTDTDTDE